MVTDLSNAEMPVVVFSFASTLTVKFVLWRPEFLFSITSRSNCSALSSVRDTQIKPRPSFAIKFIASGVANSDAITRSPSFSLSSLSITITGFPSAMSLRMSATELNFILSFGHQILYVFRHDIYLNIN